jgi:hydrocephalus-inducing protein
MTPLCVLHFHPQVSCSSTLLQPGQSSSLAITFRPSAPLAYEEVLALEVNGLFTIPVTLKGEGCPLALELANPAQRKVNFGSVMVKQSASSTVALVNRSRAPVTASLAPALEVRMMLCAAS